MRRRGRGRLFDGYPQIVKEEGSAPRYGVRAEKDVIVRMRDGVRIAVDVYRPDAEGERFPALLAFGMWGEDLQEAVAWLREHPQPYYDSPFWDGTMEAMDYTYTVPRGYVHVIPDPRGTGNSEGYDRPETTYTLLVSVCTSPGFIDECLSKRLVKRMRDLRMRMVCA